MLEIIDYLKLLSLLVEELGVKEIESSFKNLSSKIVKVVEKVFHSQKSLFTYKMGLNSYLINYRI